MQAISIALLAELALVGGGYAVLRRPVRRRIARPIQGARSAMVRRRAKSALGFRRLGRILRRVGAPIERVRWDWAAQLRTIRLTPAAGGALVAFGGAQTITLAAVLLYRLITYWGCIPAGGLA